MAKSNEEYFNDSILEHLSSIDDDRLARIADAVAKFTNNYKEYVRNQQQTEKKNEVVKTLKDSEKNRKAEAVKSEAYLKKMAENSNVQSNTLTKILENSLDSKNAQETLQKLQEKSLSSSRALNQDIIKGLTELSASSADNVKTSEKLYSLTEDMQKENTQARLQGMIKDTKRFRLESNYWKSLTGNIKSFASEFHDFKNNPSAWMAEAMGDMLGKALDKSIDGIKDTLSAGIKSITDGLGGLKSSIFDMMAEQKKRAESLAQEFNRSYMEASGVLNKSNTAISMLAQRGELDISRTSKHADVITSKLLRRFGDELGDMSQELYNEHFKAYAQLINAGAGDKIDEIEEIAAGNEKLMKKLIDSETKLAGIRSRQDARIRKGMEAAAYTYDEAHRLGIKYDQLADINERSQLFTARVMASNKELGAEEIKAFTALQKALMSQDFVSNVLDDKNVNLSQLIGIDSNQAKKILTSGSDKDRLDFMNRIVQSGAYNDIPALKRMMEDLGFDAQSLNVLSKQGALKIDDNSIKRIKDAESKDFTKINDVLLSSGSKINEEIRARISMLSSEGIRNKDKSLTEMGEEQVKALKEFNTLEKIIREENLETKEQRQHAKELYDIIRDYSSGNQEAIEKFSNLSDSDKELAEKILIASDKSEKLVQDQLQISETLSDAQDLGLDKALSGGGLSGLFSGLLDAGMKSAYSPEYQDKLSSFMDNIKKSIEPAVNVFKELLIDPIIDSLQDIVGKLLGEILVNVKGIYYKVTDTAYSEEEKQLDRSRFLRSTNVGKDLMNIDEIASSSKYSKDYKKALLNIDNLTMEDIDKLNLSSRESVGLKNFIARNSAIMNTGGRVLGSKTVGNLDLSDLYTSEKLNKMLSDITLEYNAENKSATTKGAENINLMLKQSSGVFFGDDPEQMIEFLAKDKSIDKTQLKETYEILKSIIGTEFGNDLNELFGLEGMGRFGGAKYSDAKQILASYLLLKSNLDLYGNEWGGVMFYSLLPHTNDPQEAKHHFIHNPTIGSEQYYAEGGIVAATKGGRRITVGEAGHDEIIIPTDPAKRARAQELLLQAQNKYGIYANDPENQDIKNQIAELLFDLRILTIQLDPVRDIIAMQDVMSAFGLLKSIGNISNISNITDQVNEDLGSIGDTPMKISPVKNMSSLGQIRSKILEAAYSYKGKPYGNLPSGTPYPPAAFVCNQLVNRAYSDAIGAKLYSELLPEGLKQIHTISGSIGKFDTLAGSVIGQNISYEQASQIAQPGDMVFIGNNPEYIKKGNPLGHTHVALYVDKDTIYDAAGYGDRTVNFHKPPKKNVTLINVLDIKPLDWYTKNELLSSESIYDPSLQSTPDASYVSSQVNRASQAKIEKERRNAEKQNRTAMEQIKEIVNNFGIKLTNADVQKQMSISVPKDKTFCTSGMTSSSGLCYGVGN